MTDILDSIEDLDENVDLVDFDEDDEAFEDIDLDNYAMNEAEAKEITEAIKSAATATYILLSQAHAQKAHKALGYSTWADYVKTEFEMSSQRSYQLMDLSRTIKEIEKAAGTEVRLTEAQARDIKRELPRITERIASETEGLDSDEASDMVERIVEETRAQKRLDDDAIKDKENALRDAEQDGYHAGLEAAADAMLEADSPNSMTESADGEFIEVEVRGDGGELSPQDSMDLYNFFSVLTNITSLPEPDDFIKIIPESRADEIENQIVEAAAWINRFQTIYELRKS